ncbi:MAG TPA: hypothetical protein VMI74_08590 [Burkholderiales bacterium]|nr:hypothetical protein [Burkholderiales bacterium]
MDSGHGIRLARLIAFGAVLLNAGAAFAQGGRSTFDHLRTTFPLTGVHAVTPCENCHVGGQMAGTPRQCEYCHRPGSRIATTFKPANHVQTNEACNNCHRSAATWQGARYNHATVAPGTCTTCHTGFFAPGKPANHLVTTASCDSCHRTAAWVPAGFNHNGVAAGSCETCHTPGGPGLAMPSNHIPYKTALLNGASLGCDACHTSTTTFTAERMNHNSSLGNGSGQCSTCHLRNSPYLGSMQKNTLNHDGTGPDCSFSGCHRPLGNQGSTYTRWTS